MDHFWNYRWAAARRLIACLAVLLAIVVLGHDEVRAQQFNNPVYIPTGLLPATTCSAACDVTMQLQNQGTVVIEVTGSGTGINAIVQVAADRAASPTWVTATADRDGTGRLAAIAATGTYRVSVDGMAQVNFHLTAVTGSISIAMAATSTDFFLSTLPAIRRTYSASALIGTGATSHFLVIAGGAGKVVRITHVECSGGATAANDVSITANVNSAADTGDAGTAVTAVPHDGNDTAAVATVLSHTTSPTPGTAVGAVRTGNLLLAKLGSSTPTGGTGLSWDFGRIRPGDKDITLRGVAQSFSLDTSAAFGSGAAVGCSITWTEE